MYTCIHVPNHSFLQHLQGIDITSLGPPPITHAHGNTQTSVNT